MTQVLYQIIMLPRIKFGILFVMGVTVSSKNCYFAKGKNLASVILYIYIFAEPLHVLN